MIELTEEEQVRKRELKRIREALGLNQAEMGDLIGKGWETVAAYEQGKRKIKGPVWTLIERAEPRKRTGRRKAARRRRLTRRTASS